MTERGFKTEITVPDDMELGYIRKMQDRIAQLDGVMTSFNLKEPVISVMMRDPRHLSVPDVPRGSHEFAYGWIMALNVQYITNLLGRPVTWEEVQIEHGRIKSVLGTFTSTVMAISEAL